MKKLGLLLLALLGTASAFAQTVATPTFSPAAGSYASAQSVAITSATTAAAICYTQDGSAPAATTAGTCSHGTQIANGATAPVTFTQTLQAIGTLAGSANSAENSGSYTITTGTTVAAFTMSHPSSPPAYQGDPVTETITGPTDATGLVTLYNGTNTTALATVQLTGGIATYTGYYTWNSNSIHFNYAGDVTYAAHTGIYGLSDVLIRLNRTSLALTSSNTNVTTGTAITLTATITSRDDTGTPAGAIIFRDRSLFCTPSTMNCDLLGSGAVTLSGGVATYTYTPTLGEHYYAAYYVSDRSNYQQSQSVVVDQTVRPTTAVACTPKSTIPSGYTSYYVSNTGSDSAAGTCAAPFLTIGHATGLVTGGGFAVLGQAGGKFTEQITMPAGTSSLPNLVDAYGSGPYPTAEEADTLTGLTWTLVSAGTYSAPYTGYPFKAYVDSVGQDSTAIQPTFNYLGACSGAAVNPYDSCLNTNSVTYTRILPHAAVGSFNANLYSWGAIAALPTSMQTTGLINVETLPGTLYANGTTLYLHLPDGTSPSGHVIQVSTRKYGFNERGQSNVQINHWNAAHMGFDAFVSQPLTSSSTATNDSNSYANGFQYGCGSVFGYDDPNEGDFYVGCSEVNAWEGGTTGNYGVTNNTLGPNLQIGSVDTFGGGDELQTNIQGIGAHAVVNLSLTGIAVSAVSAEDIDFGNYGSQMDTGTSASNLNLSNGGSGLRVSGLSGGNFQNVIIHDFLGFGDQCGGSSTNVVENEFLIYNGRGTSGLTDYLTPGVTGGGGALFNGGDGNGGCTNVTKTHYSCYNISGNCQTLENGSPYAIQANLLYNAWTPEDDVRPDNTVLTTSTPTGPSGMFTLLYRKESQPPSTYSGNLSTAAPGEPSFINWSGTGSATDAIGEGQMDLNASGTNNIYVPSASGYAKYVNPAIGNFNYSAGSAAIGNSGDSVNPNIGYSSVAGTATACGTLSGVQIFQGYPSNSSAFGYATVNVGQYMAFALVGTCADGTTRSIPANLVTWTSSNTAVATISAQTSHVASPVQGAVATNGVFGILAAQGVGTAVITGAYGGQSSTAGWPLSAGGSTSTATVSAGTAFPTASPAAGSYSSAQSVVLSDTTSGAVIYYTTDGSTPTTASTVYSAAIPVASTLTINAIASVSGGASSQVASFPYTITGGTAAAPSFSPGAGSYTTAQTVTITSATSGSVICYTTNGTTPAATTPGTCSTGTSITNGSSITIGSSVTLMAIASMSGDANSSVTSAAYSIAAAVPTFSPAGGSYASVQNVTIASTTPSASIYYCVGAGCTPTTSSILYSGPVSVSSTQTLNAIATSTGFAQSASSSAAYTITLPTAATPTFSPVAGTYSGTQTITISDATSGSTIYYTVDGSTPTTASPIYSGAFSVATSKTVKALASASGYNNSAVGSAAYTITGVAGTCVIAGNVKTTGTGIKISFQ